MLTAYTLYGAPTDACNTVQPVATTLTFTSTGGTAAYPTGTVTGATVLADGTSSTFSATFTLSGNVFALNDTCPDTNAAMIGWGTTGTPAMGFIVEFEFGGVSGLTPLNAGCNAIASYTLQQ